jgi:hypothetical protein
MVRPSYLIFMYFEQIFWLLLQQVNAANNEEMDKEGCVSYW